MRLTIASQLDTDPELEIGSVLVIERADGRSVWKQRLVVTHKTDFEYVAAPVADIYPQPLGIYSKRK